MIVNPIQKIQKNSLRLDTKNYTLVDIKKEVEEDVGLLISLGYNDLKWKSYSVSFGKKVYTLGTCKKNNFASYNISINQEYLRVASPDEVHNTIMHECIHSIDGCMNHGEKWKNAANKVNKHFKFSPISRVSYVAEYEPILKSHQKYHITCNKCGATWNFVRKSKSWTACCANRAKCPYCKGSDFKCESD